MSRRPFPGAPTSRRTARGGITTTVVTLFIAGVVYGLVRERVTPDYSPDHIQRPRNGHLFPSAHVDDSGLDGEAYVRERLAEKIHEHEKEEGERRRAREREGAKMTKTKTKTTATERQTSSDSRTSVSEKTKVIPSNAIVRSDVAQWDGYEADEWRRIRDAEAPDDECHELPLSDYWGPSPVGTASDVGAVKSARDCCETCKKTAGCQFWRHDPVKPSECYTGKLMNDYLPPMYGEEHKKLTTTGVLYPKIPKYDAESTDLKTCLHTMITSNGAAYMNWQTRVFYQTWKKAASEKDSILRHFTRILHRTTDDELMGMIPTWRAVPTHAECDTFCDYAVKDRARAIADWMKTDDSKRCSHILMAETDYLFIRSPPPSVLLSKGYSYGFLFGYIVPSHPTAKNASKVLHDEEKDGPLREVYQTGNAPQSIHRDDLERVAQVWAEKVELGETSDVVKKDFGWVRDMYAWSFAAAAVRPKLHFELPPVPFQKLVIQPPADITIGQASLMHYTWGAIVSDKDDKKLWSFDKREYQGRWDSLRKIETPPPWEAERGFKLQDGKVMQESQYKILQEMIEIFNSAIDVILTNDAAKKTS